MRILSMYLITALVGMTITPLSAQEPTLGKNENNLTTILTAKLAESKPSDLLPVYAKFAGLPTLDEMLPVVRNMSKADRREYVINLLRNATTAAQHQVRQYLETEQGAGRAKFKRQLWINNVLAFEATPAVIETVARMTNVMYVNLDRIERKEEVEDGRVSEAASSSLGQGGAPTASLLKINADDAWAKGHTGAGVLVAIVDSGINYNHPDLVNNRWTNPDEINGNGIDDDGNGYIDDFCGWDFGGDDNDPIDTSVGSHGTAVAGLVCGDGTSGTATGVAPDATYIVLKIAGATESEWWEAYQYAVMEGADVVDSSYSKKWPGQPDYNSFRDATDSELAAGVIHANSIGNQGTGSAGSHPIPFNVSTPGNCPPPWMHPDQGAAVGTNSHISAVMGCGNLNATSNFETIDPGSGVGPAAWGQCDADLTLGGTYPLPFTPHNDYPVAATCGGMGGLIKPDVCAPGAGTTSTGNSYLTGGSAYTGFGGTSAATPHLGGLMCLVLSAAPHLNPEQVCQIIQTTAVQTTSDPSAAKDNNYGAGRIDCLGAVSAAETAGNGVRRLLITEVSSGNPDYAEITNFTTSAIDLTGWTFVWKDGSTQSSGLGTTVIEPGQTIGLVECGAVCSLNLPAPLVEISLSFSIGSASGDFAAAIVDPNGFVVDEVHVAAIGGAYAEGSLGGIFRGEVTRDGTYSTATSGCIERIWGLDSDGGLDWTDQVDTSPGLENRSSGPRGADTAAVNSLIKINEIDDAPDYIELYNSGPSEICLPFPPVCIPLYTNLKNWFLVVGDELGAQSRTITRPFSSDTYLQGGSYLILGDGATPPAEMPAGTTYIDVSANLPFSSAREFSVVLYDHLGRVVDAMRTTLPDRNLVYNHPRMPTHWNDFTGSAMRTLSGDGCVGRDSASTDLGNGADWRPVSVRTMGSANSGFVAGLSSNGDVLDVRGNEGGFPGDGATVIINGGASAAGWSYGQMWSGGHLFGGGPFIGLGADAPQNWLNLLGAPPFFGSLDADGSARYDFMPSSVPPGFQLDVLFYVTNGTSVRISSIVEFDT